MSQMVVTDQKVQDEMLGDALGLKAGADPFPWQREVLRTFPLPGVRRYSLDIPTGLGKTSVMAIWLVARALGRDVPRRLVYVVDRRTVVDQATTIAENLREWLEKHPDLKQQLRLGTHKLPVSTLRGQYIDNREWLECPSLPAIIVGTVDMIGSRLLFEGYRTSRKMRPYHAGLLGVDSLLVLDEAHLVPPFERLVDAMAVRKSEFGPSRPGCEVPPFLLMTLSATGRDAEPKPEAHSYKLTPDDFAHPVVARRLNAAKHARLIPLEDVRQMAEVLAQRAWELANRNEGRRCIVYCQRRDTAQQTYDLLQKKSSRVELLVGARRVHEREMAAKSLARLGFIAGKPPEHEGPAFLVATSAGEVGIDLDADDMVSDLVPWERMVQRFGRVNRRGEGEATIDILLMPESTGTSSSEETEREVDEARASRYTAPFEHLPRNGHHVDVSPQALLDLKSQADIAGLLRAASSPVPLHPPLQRAHIDAWSMTSLIEHTGRPAIEPWLRGWVEGEPAQCAVLWRSFLPLASNEAPSATLIEGFFEAAPVHALEILETECFRVAEWLIDRATALRETGKEMSAPIAIILDGAGKCKRTWDVHQLCQKETHRKKTRDVLGNDLADMTLIVEASVAGLQAGLLASKHDAPPPTLDGETFDTEAEPDFRVRRQSRDAEVPRDIGWKVLQRFVVEWSENDDALVEIVVEQKQATSEESKSVGKLQSLEKHQCWAQMRAQSIGENLAPHRAQILALAASLHDEGKKARRWQLAFKAPPGEVYAKTPGPVNVALLEGYRHEFGSLGYAEAHDAVRSLGPEDRDLLLHLIAAHHGFSRPVVSAEGCEDAPPSALQTRRREVVLRFLRLQKQWGPWGLAWMEALLRAADQQASRLNDEGGEP